VRSGDDGLVGAATSPRREFDTAGPEFSCPRSCDRGVEPVDALVVDPPAFLPQLQVSRARLSTRGTARRARAVLDIWAVTWGRSRT